MQGATVTFFLFVVLEFCKFALYANVWEMKTSLAKKREKKEKKKLNWCMSEVVTDLELY